MSAATLERFLFWSPRVLGTAFAVFLGIFALDVFDQNLGVLGTVVALFMHLIPALFVAAGVALAWQWERLGALLFGVLAAGYAVVSWGRFPVATVAAISGPMALIAVLFVSHAKFVEPTGNSGVPRTS